MELALAFLHIVESISPVNSQKTDHRQENPHADTGTALDLEGIEITDIRPAVTPFEEAEHKNRGGRLKYHRISQLNGELVIYVTRIGIIAGLAVVLRELIRGKGIILITAEGYDFRAVSAVSGHTVTAEEEALER